jgi:hypothetical protein
MSCQFNEADKQETSTLSPAVRRARVPRLQPKGSCIVTYEVKSVAFFYEIRNRGDSIIKRDGGFATANAAKAAAREDARNMKTRHPRPDIGRILVGQNMGKPTRN